MEQWTVFNAEYAFSNCLRRYDDIGWGLAIGRCFEGQKITGVFKFTGMDKSVTSPWEPGGFTDLLAGKKYMPEGLHITAHECYYMEREQSRKSTEAEPADA